MRGGALECARCALKVHQRPSAWVVGSDGVMGCAKGGGWEREGCVFMQDVLVCGAKRRVEGDWCL